MRRSAFFALSVFLVLTGRASAQLVPRDGSSPIAVRSQRVEALVEDGLARTTVRQTFVNPHDRPLEALYVFPVIVYLLHTCLGPSPPMFHVCPNASSLRTLLIKLGHTLDETFHRLCSDSKS